ncbi:MAG: benzoate-CoA ligase family protein [Gammaproteobacteria bacterium]|nr:benzoate-CoA ligase family protein [Gammaproteobacteria bacterium]
MNARKIFEPGRMNAAEELLGPPLAAGRDDSTALICGPRSLSYGELDRLANRYGNAMVEAGVEQENRVLIFMDDSPDMVAAYLATMKIGAVAIAINVRVAPDDLRFVIEESRCKLLFIDACHEQLYRAIEGEFAHPPVVVPGGADSGPAHQDFVGHHADTLNYVPMAEDDMAFWLYTSGTTGKPKAVVHSHHDVLIADRHLRENLNLVPGERILTTSKISFAYALGHSFFGGLRCGATVILHTGWPDCGSILREIERSAPDLFCSVPSFYRNLLREGAAQSRAFNRIRHCISAGEHLPEQLFRQWREITSVTILEGIGTTETIFLFLSNTPGAARAGSVGRALPWADVRLLGSGGDEIADAGAVGTLWVRMDSLFDRYWNQQARTHAAFKDGFYCTGDLFSFDADGYWHYQGRADDMLKISGQWVSPVEIEECVLCVPDVAEAAVIGREDADGLVRAALFVVPAPGRPVPELEQAIRTTLLSHLSIYKCPRTIRFVSEIPRTRTGKVQRFKLHQLL